MNSMRNKTRKFALIAVGIACAMNSTTLFAQNVIDSPPANPLTPRHNVNQPKNSPPAKQVTQRKVTQRNETPDTNYVSVSPIQATPVSTSAESTDDPLNQKLVTPNEKKQKPFSGFVTSKSGNSILKVIGGLSAVLAIFYAFTIFAKRNGAKVSSKLPADIIQVLGTMPIDAKRKFQLVRLGSKLLLLSVTEKSVQTVSEITDPVEVEYFVSRLQKGKTAEAFNSMRQMMAQIRQQKRALRMYPSQIPPDFEEESTDRRLTGANVFEA